MHSRVSAAMSTSKVNGSGRANGPLRSIRCAGEKELDMCGVRESCVSAGYVLLWAGVEKGQYSRGIRWASGRNGMPRDLWPGKKVV
jgi:hypothetical protein